MSVETKGEVMKKTLITAALLFAFSIAVENTSYQLKPGDEAAKFIAFHLEDSMAGSDSFDKAFKLSSVLGKKPVILAFFTKECVNCPIEIKQLQKLAETYKDSDLDIYLVLLKTSEDPLSGESFSEKDIFKDVSERSYTLPILYHKYPETIFKLYVKDTQGQTIPVPLTYFIDKEGKVSTIKKGFNTKDIENETKKLKSYIEAIL